VHERNQGQAKEFENWLESKLNILGVLGDFIVRYAITKPETPENSILLSGHCHEEMAQEIISQLYKYANRDKPEWLDRLYEQKSVLEENTERAYFEIRAFLMNQISEAYSRHSKTINPNFDLDIIVTFEMRINYCLENKLLPYLHEHSRRDGEKEIRITHDMLTELHKKTENLESVTTMQDLAKELPNFTYINAKIGPKSAWILSGKRKDLIVFLETRTEELGYQRLMVD
jgi:hypothetical protein